MDGRSRQAALERALQGDVQALGELLESFRPYVGVILHSFRDERLQARLETADLIQDAFLEASRSFATFRGQTVGELVVWLRQIVRRSAGHTMRSFVGTDKRDPSREQALEDAGDVPADSGSSPSAHAIRQEQSVRMAEALARLPEDMQQVLLGRHVDALPYAALAQRMGRTEAALRVLYVRALQELRKLYHE
jgi:RNA polymerase sigma-70 factor (ECF subfamily)